MRIERLLPARFRRDESGATALIVGLSMTMLMGFLALGVDLSSLYFRQKALQTRADLAAISAVNALTSDPVAKAQTTLTGNGLDAEMLTGTRYWHYVRDPDLAPLDRLSARELSQADVNAVTVDLDETVPLYFAQTFLPQDSVSLRASATATKLEMASFSLGSRLASLDAGVLNALLDAALGSTVSLSLLDSDYGALANTQIDLLTFTDALAVRLDLDAVSYEDILKTDIDLLDIAGALLDTGLVSGSTNVLTAILNSAGSGILGAEQLIGIDGDDVGVQLEDILPLITVSALDILKAAVDVINADRLIALDVPVTIPGLTSVDLSLVVGERTAGSGWITLGSRGATVHTAQVRLKLDVGVETSVLAGLGLGNLAAVRVPLYLEVASATATLSALHCNAVDPSDPLVTFDTGIDPMTGVTGAHVAEVFLGSFDAPDFADTTTPLDQADLAPATLLEINVLSLARVAIKVKAHTGVGVSDTPQITFTLAENPSLTGVSAGPREYGSEQLLSSAVGGLLGSLQLTTEVEVLGLDLLGILSGLVTALVSTVTGLLGPILTLVLQPVDLLVDNLTDTLGLGLGEAKLYLDGVHCGNVMLVQ